jgi:spore maturation protein SpmB
MLIMIALEISKVMGWMDAVNKVFRPVMRGFGLSERATTMFVAGLVFGLLYGGAVIVEEARKGRLTREDTQQLHISLGINHGVIEDPALFATLGLNLLWLLVPRLVTAIVAVHIWRAARRIFGRPVQAF